MHKKTGTLQFDPDIDKIERAIREAASGETKEQKAVLKVRKTQEGGFELCWLFLRFRLLKSLIRSS